MPVAIMPPPGMNRFPQQQIVPFPMQQQHPQAQGGFQHQHHHHHARPPMMMHHNPNHQAGFGRPPMQQPSHHSGAGGAGGVGKPGRMLASNIPDPVADKLLTVFVGRIPDGPLDDDTIMERILMACGHVKSWRRAADSPQELRAFGFAVVANIETLYKMMRIMGGEGRRGVGIELPGTNSNSNIKLTIDEVARKQLDTYRKSQPKPDPAADEIIFNVIQDILAPIRKGAAEKFLSSIDMDDETSPTTAAAAAPNRPLSPSALIDYKHIPLDASEIFVNPNNVRPEDMTPEYQQLISREISLFRDRAAQKDKAKREREEERRRQIERERERVLGTSSGAGDINHRGGRPDDDRRRDESNVSSVDDMSRRSSSSSTSFDPEEEKRSEERRQRELMDSFYERERRWEAQEQARFKKLDRDAEKDEDDRLRMLADKEVAESFLRAYDDDMEAERKEHEFYKDRDRWWTRRKTFRTREIDFDQEDVDTEIREAREMERRQREEEERKINGEAARDAAAEEFDTSASASLPVVGRIMTMEERQTAIKQLVESIPSERVELFKYPIKWDLVSQALVDVKLRPFVNKKIMEYLGDEEPDLCNFILGMITKRSTAEEFYEEMQQALDEEGEKFVIKLWRMLIFESESISLGL